MDAFYDYVQRSGLDSRIRGETGTEVIRLCEEIGRSAIRPAPSKPPAKISAAAPAPVSPRILILGASGFIGQELLRQLTDAGQEVRILVRNPGRLGRSR